MTTHELWTHPRSGEVYAFRLEEGRVTGCYGPLTLREMAPENLADYPYEELPAAIRRVADSPEPFAGAARVTLGLTLPPRAGRGAGVVARALERVAARRRARHA